MNLLRSTWVMRHFTLRHWLMLLSPVTAEVLAQALLHRHDGRSALVLVMGGPYVEAFHGGGAQLALGWSWIATTVWFLWQASALVPADLRGPLALVLVRGLGRTRWIVDLLAWLGAAAGIYTLWAGGGAILMDWIRGTAGPDWHMAGVTVLLWWLGLWAAGASAVFLGLWWRSGYYAFIAMTGVTVASLVVAPVTLWLPGLQWVLSVHGPPQGLEAASSALYLAGWGAGASASCILLAGRIDLQQP